MLSSGRRERIRRLCRCRRFPATRTFGFFRRCSEVLLIRGHPGNPRINSVSSPAWLRRRPDWPSLLDSLRRGALAALRVHLDRGALLWHGVRLPEQHSGQILGDCSRLARHQVRQNDHNGVLVGKAGNVAGKTVDAAPVSNVLLPERRSNGTDRSPDNANRVLRD